MMGCFLHILLCFESDCNVTYTPVPVTINTDTLDPQTSNFEKEKVNTQLFTSNLNEFITDKNILLRVRVKFNHN